MMDITFDYIIRILLAFIFLRAAWHKIKHRAVFYGELRAYQLIPNFFLPSAVIALPIIEIYCGFGLLNLHWQSPPFIAIALLIIYGLAMAINLVRGKTEIDCGCRGPVSSNQQKSRQTISWLLVLRNAILACLGGFCLSPYTVRDLSNFDRISIVLASIVVLLLYETIEQAIFNYQTQQRFLGRT